MSTSYAEHFKKQNLPALGKRKGSLEFIALGFSTGTVEKPGSFQHPSYSSWLQAILSSHVSNKLLGIGKVIIGSLLTFVQSQRQEKQWHCRRVGLMAKALLEFNP